MMRLRLGRGRVTEPVTAAHLTSERVWNELENAAFGVISYVTPAGRPPRERCRVRSSRPTPVRGHRPGQLEGAPDLRRR
jgi:hypothetical protein